MEKLTNSFIHLPSSSTTYSTSTLPPSIIIIIITINMLTKCYIYYRNRYIYSLNVERLVLLNGKAIDYLTFKNIKSTLNFSSEKFLKLMLNVTLQYLTNVYDKDIKLSIVFFEYDPKSYLYRSISDGYVFELNKDLSVNDLYKNIKWVNSKFNHISNNIVVVIKPCNS
jgi:hypothetical protein